MCAVGELSGLSLAANEAFECFFMELLCRAALKLASGLCWRGWPMFVLLNLLSGAEAFEFDLKKSCIYMSICLELLLPCRWLLAFLPALAFDMACIACLIFFFWLGPLDAYLFVMNLKKGMTSLFFWRTRCLMVSNPTMLIAAYSSFYS